MYQFVLCSKQRDKRLDLEEIDKVARPRPLRNSSLDLCCVFLGLHYVLPLVNNRKWLVKYQLRYLGVPMQPTLRKTANC